MHPSPIDPTSTPAWSKLGEIMQNFTPDFRAWFAENPGRAEEFSYTAADLHVDLSKSFLTGEIRDALVGLAKETAVEERRDAMMRGDRINVTEDRAVLHTALRAPRGSEIIVDGENVVDQVHEVLDRVYAFAERVRSGEWVGATGRPIETVVNIGIGGSDLGPVMAYEALKPYLQEDLEVRFISNIDPTDAGEKLAGLDPETTLFIIVSKTFTTMETLTNAKVARAWLLDSLPEEARDDAVATHFVAVSTALDKVAEFGIDPENAFGFWSWVGGRYSVGSAVGTSLAIAIGPDNFADFLAGLRAMDEHFAKAPAEENVPLLMGMLNVFYVNLMGAASHAVLPYSQYLHRFPAYLQQLTMESNGKSVRWDGSAVTTATGEVFWGEPGTNGQHAFYQLIHQGTQLIPADFIAFANPTYPFETDGNDQHELLLGNFFAQTKALAFGKSADEVRAEGTDEAIVPARVFPGNKPTASIMAPYLSPSVLGQLIALYEHITFVQGIVWGVDSFDQWGVELGKEMASDLGPAIAGDDEALGEQDPSTRSLIAYYHRFRDARPAAEK